MPIAEPIAPSSSYSQHVNPQWVKLLNVLDLSVNYERCVGAELFTTDGRRILDFLSGYCVHNVGHNHPDVVSAVMDELQKRGPVMLQSHVPELAGELAERLCWRAGGRLSKVFFASSGSEGIEAAIKFSRAHTGRTGLLYADRAFHGLTCGASVAHEWRVLARWIWPAPSGNGRGALRGSRRPSNRNSPPGATRHSSSSRVQSEGGIRIPDDPTTFRRRRRYAGSTDRSLFWTKCRPACIAPAHFLRRIILASIPILSCWLRH